jgi:hypothetical protein
MHCVLMFDSRQPGKMMQCIRASRTQLAETRGDAATDCATLRMHILLCFVHTEY